MTSASSSPVIRARNAKYQSNVTKRGNVKSVIAEKRAAAAQKPAVSPYLVFFFIAILGGGAVFELLRLFGAGAN
ncbi:hypothetical protein BGW38_001508 [Lunasporangiospora selenospora]|uniref:Stress-associated endoplasmic reticulum protein n=1 Tax=Lunasporangiospora selenospora TaxID=979761 RepID=A0A9P6FTV0_9FUNG|nr:hypothetical protein BGW38_001508 [Lunasporangiospora selenospora]